MQNKNLTCTKPKACHVHLVRSHVVEFGKFSQSFSRTGLPFSIILFFPLYMKYRTYRTASCTNAIAAKVYLSQKIFCWIISPPFLASVFLLGQENRLVFALVFHGGSLSVVCQSEQQCETTECVFITLPICEVIISCMRVWDKLNMNSFQKYMSLFTWEQGLVIVCSKGK